jgi:hypothetical protein
LFVTTRSLSLPPSASQKLAGVYSQEAQMTYETRIGRAYLAGEHGL